MSKVATECFILLMLNEFNEVFVFGLTVSILDFIENIARVVKFVDLSVSDITGKLFR